MIVLPISHYISLIHFSLKGWENVPFELGSETFDVVDKDTESKSE